MLDINMLLQIIGLIAILIAYALSQFGALDLKSIPYLTINIVGSGLLGISAFFASQWGFVALEAAWAIISLIELIRKGLKSKK